MSRAALLLLLALALAGDASAAGSRYKKKKPGNRDYRTAVEKVDAGDYAGAIPYLQQAAERDPDDADVFNLLGFTHRKTGRLDVAEGYYREALRLDPKHRGAHEYLGELYLQRGDVAAAERQLAVLDRLCWLPCSEERKLEKSIAAHRAELEAAPQ